jgi:hypothetical protein
VDGLRAHLDKYHLVGVTPNLIIIDYAELMRLGGRKDSRKDELIQELYEELRGLAGEYMVPLWTASQTNRSAAEDDVIEGDKVSESYGKNFTVDFGMSLSRKSKDKLGNTARWHVFKNRFGPDGVTFPSKMDTSKGRIDIYKESSVNGAKAKEEMLPDKEFNRQYLAQAYTQMSLPPNMPRAEPKAEDF